MKINQRFLWGGLLILAGGLFLFQNLGLIPSAWSVIWALFFAAAGCVFLYAYLTDRSQWWPLIPGISLLGLAALIFIDQLLPGIDGSWSGSIFLGGIALAFWLVFITHRQNWWALIPAGVLSTLAAITLLDSFVDDTGFMFFLGLGLTFALVGAIPTPAGRMSWAFIPAVVLIILAIFTSPTLLPLINYIWPVALILLGGYFIIRNLR